MRLIIEFILYFLPIAFSDYRIYNHIGGDNVMFQIDPNKPKKQSINRTVRIPNKTYEKLEELTKTNGISFNRLVVQCVEYALDNMEE